MRTLVSLCAAFLLVFFWSGGAEAHRVNVFAYVDGGTVHVECAFSRSQKVRQGKIEVFDAVSGQKLVEGVTDEAGVFRFPVPAGAKEAGHGLRIRLLAGEGHQNDWEVAADELQNASSPSLAPALAEKPPLKAEAVKSENMPDAMKREQAKPAVPAAALSAAEAERIINAALDARLDSKLDAKLDAKLAPIKHMLAQQTEAGPSLRDIIGGIGWIFGLVGIAAYFRRRP